MKASEKPLFYLAPMEGITYSVVRNAFARNFSGIDKYFTPFIPVGKAWSKKIHRDLDPANNPDIVLVPQVISNAAEEVLSHEQKLLDFGYEEYNINLGCPAGTVVSKGRGAGFLRDTEKLDNFLEEIFSRTRMKVSVKTRIGLEDTSEWDEILSVYKKYPLSELIIHPRLRIEQYKGRVHTESYEKACGEISVPLCYNGDITDKESFEKIHGSFPGTKRFMIGRGLLARPWLIEELFGIYGQENLLQKVRTFHDEIYDGYTCIFSGEKDTIMHMKEIWSHLGKSFPEKEKLLKKLLKTKEPSEYKILVKEILISTS